MQANALKASQMSAICKHLPAFSMGYVGGRVGLCVFRHLRNLRSLKLSGGNFTDIGLCMLTGLKALRSLNLSFCNNITDEGFRAVVIPLSRHSLAQVDVSHRDGATPLSSVSRV